MDEPQEQQENSNSRPWLARYQFKPGQSGNPGGRPKGSDLRAIILALLAEEDKRYGTKGEKFIRWMMVHAARGDFRYCKEIMDRILGPVPTKAEISGPDGGPVSIYKCVKGDWPEKV